MTRTVPCTASVAAWSIVLPESGAGCGGCVRTVAQARLEAAAAPRVRKKLDRFSQLALLAAGPLVEAGREVPRGRLGLFLGNDLAGWNFAYDQVARLRATHDAEAIGPYLATAWFPAAAQGEVTIAHGILGESKTFAAGCLSGALAIEYAARLVARGNLDVAWAGGVEAPDAPVVVRALAARGRISPQHPAAEAAALLALLPAGRPRTAKLTISAPRASMGAALDEVAARLAGRRAVRAFYPPVGAANVGWRRIRAEIEAHARAVVGPRLTAATTPWADMDLGSALFPAAVAEACQAPEPALVFGTDFEGLHMVALVVPPSEGD